MKVRSPSVSGRLGIGIAGLVEISCVVPEFVWSLKTRDHPGRSASPTIGGEIRHVVRCGINCQGRCYKIGMCANFSAQSNHQFRGATVVEACTSPCNVAALFDPGI